MKPYYDDGRGIVIYHGDCRDVLSDVRDIDIVLTDPPFSVPVKYHDSAGAFYRGWGDLLVMEPFFAEVFGLLRGCSRPTSQLYVCCDENTYPVFYKICYPIYTRSRLIVWYKPTGRRGTGWKHSHELILHLSGANTIYSKAFNQDVIGIMPTRTLNRMHPAEKPGELLAFLCEAFPVSATATALDPFMGSGTTLVVAKQLGMRAVGIEIEERYCEIAAKRLEQEVFDFTEPEPQPEPMSLFTEAGR